jgi:hypothetical protein
MIDPVSAQGVASEQQALNFLSWLFVSRAGIIASSQTCRGLIEFSQQRHNRNLRWQPFR